MWQIDKNWTLFLDRDGVINQKLENDYVKDFEEFVFMPSLLEALRALRPRFGLFVVVTNQQGIGKGLMTENDLLRLHWQMQVAMQEYEVQIDKIYHCPDLAAANSPNRKPEIGMALQAKLDFPKIDFAKSIMIGDSISDMEFGKKAGMKTIFLSKKKTENNFIDVQLQSWVEVVEFLGVQQQPIP